MPGWPFSAARAQRRCRSAARWRGAVIGIAALSAALVFSASLDHLFATPRLYGVTWDASVVVGTDTVGLAPAVTAVTGNPQVVAWSAGYSGIPARIGGLPMETMAMSQRRGSPLMPVLVEGRLPQAIGFTRGQIRRVVAWQAATLTAVALVIGIPAGLLCGRVAWLIFAYRLGILPVLTVPLSQFAVVAGGALVLAVAIAALPGESAARARPTQVLRSE